MRATLDHSLLELNKLLDEMKQPRDLGRLLRYLLPAGDSKLVPAGG